MARQPDPKPDDPAQYQRFRELAADLGAEDGSEKAVERAVKKLAKEPRPPKPGKAKG